MHPQIISEPAIRGSISFDEASIAAVEKAFASLANAGAVVMPPVMQINVDAVQGQTCIKSAYIPGDDFFVVKLASTFHQNPKFDVSSASGLMLVCNSLTGHVECILLDNGYLTALRTQAAGAVAAKHLSRRNSKCAALIGAGRQARLQLVALVSVRPIERATVWSPNSEECEAFASDMRATLGIDVRSTSSAEAAVRGADIIVTATPARTPLIKAEWLSPGQHITAMGADAPGKSELWPETLLKANLYACDRVAQCKLLSELHAAIEAGVVPADFPAAEIGEIISGLRKGRVSDADITIADLTGLGVQDTAIALLAWSRIRSEGPYSR